LLFPLYQAILRKKGEKNMSGRKIHIISLLILISAMGAEAQPADDYQILWQCSGANSTSEFGFGLVCAGDQDLDGCDDILIAALYDYRVYLYYGGADMDTIADLTFGPYSSSNTGVYLSKECRDLNGDGYPDIAIGASNTALLQRCVYLYFGGPTLNNQYDLLFMPGPPGTSHGDYGRYISMGDINGDDKYDLVVGAPDWSIGGTSGKIFVYYGGADMDTTADFTITGTYSTYIQIGTRLSAVGDVNNDGYDDIFTVGKVSGYSDGILLYFGGSPLDSVPDWELLDPWGDGEDFGMFIMPDINNDGFDELIYGDQWDNKGYIFYGGTNISTSPNVNLIGESGVFTHRCAFLGDINNDGYNDCATAEYNENISVFFLGPNLGNTKYYDLLIEGDDICGGDLAAAGDINGDGVDELMYGTSISGIWDRGTVYIYGNPDLVVNNHSASVPPFTFTLHPCYPNPFNNSTTISFTLDKILPAKLSVYNQLGQKVWDCGFRIWDIGVNKVVWDAEGLASGTYVVELEQGREKRTVKVQLIK